MMIRNYAAVQAPLEAVRTVYQDIEAWRRWMPSLKTLRILKRDDDFSLIELVTIHMGMEFYQKMELHVNGNNVTQHQVAGRFKKWDAEWRMVSAPDGDGTTISFSLDIDPGMMGMFLSKQLLVSTINDWFTRMVRKAEQRARVVTVQSATQQLASQPLVRREPAVVPEETLLQVFQTAKGLEVWILKQRFLIPYSG